MKRIGLLIAFSAVIAFSLAQSTFAQPTEFTYQGRLLSGALPANGSHDFEFRLFSDPAGDVQVGSAVTLTDVNVNNGVFSVRLDFGNQFPGANRFLEIRVRQSGDPVFALLAPRQAITSAPYSIKSLSAENAANAANTTQLGGIAANQFVLTGDGRLSDARNPLANSPNYIQNTTSQQVLSNFNVSGTGRVGGTMTANIFNAQTQYSIGGQRVLAADVIKSNTFVGIGPGFLNSSGQNNTFVGSSAGLINTTGLNNSFFGASAGIDNTTGYRNSFFGTFAGNSNTAGPDNSFFGDSAGRDNTTGSSNSFVGSAAGRLNTTGNFNSFFGFFAGGVNTNGSNNSFFGFRTGVNTTSSNNSFFGSQAGTSNTTGANNSFLGVLAGQSNSTGNQNAFFGAEAGRSNTGGTSNSFHGAFAGGNNTTGNFNSFFGTFSGTTNTTGIRNSFVGNSSGGGNTTGNDNVFIGFSAGNTNTSGNSNTIIGTDADVASSSLSFATAVGAGAVVSTSNTIVLGRNSDGVVIPGSLRVNALGSGGSTQLCRSASNQITFCSSSLHYKSQITPFGSGLNLINRLRPISFVWKDGGMADLGLGAEDVEKIEPLLVTRNDKGEVEGVKYDRVGVVLVNAVQEQQRQIEAQQKQIDEQKSITGRQQAELEALKKFACSQNPAAEVCQPKN